MGQDTGGEALTMSQARTATQAQGATQGGSPHKAEQAGSTRRYGCPNPTSMNAFLAFSSSFTRACSFCLHTEDNERGRNHLCQELQAQAGRNRCSLDHPQRLPAAGHRREQLG